MHAYINRNTRNIVIYIHNFNWKQFLSFKILKKIHYSLLVPFVLVVLIHIVLLSEIIKTKTVKDIIK